jgi:anaerobic carbon-monoxide dehydrogenase iron sulfur subunit
MKIVAINPDECVGCRNCEYACSFEQTGDFNRNDSNIKMNFYPEEVVCLPLTCLHCKQAWCMEVCPADAIVRDNKTGAVVIIEERCAGCKMCMIACPFGSIRFNTQKMVSEKCNLCQGDPKCVKYCISGALKFQDDEMVDSQRKTFDGKLISVLHNSRRIGGNI